ncbi:MAG: carboxypeptidase-like regulatory domain-containing protein [Bacteroidota bacterium]
MFGMRFVPLAIFLFCCALAAPAQDGVLRGRILSLNDGQGVGNVNIQVADRRGTVSDSTGRFALRTDRFPVVLRLSHIAYREREYRLNGPTDSLLLIFMEAMATDLEEVVVAGRQAPQPLSTTEECSVLDFAVLGETLLRLEYHGSFKPYRLALIDADGTLLGELWLRKMRAVERLHRGCNNDWYLVASASIHALDFSEGQLRLGQRLAFDTFDQLIQPCRLHHQRQLYYLFPRSNGLQQVLRTYDLDSQQVRTLRIVGDNEQLANYRADQAYIRRSARINSMRTNDYNVNRAQRRLQADSEFLSRVFYRPEFPLTLMAQGEDILLFNHPEQQLECYRAGEWQHSVPLAYPAEARWSKQVVVDWVEEEAYALFEDDGRVLLRRVNPRTGSTLLTADVLLEGRKFVKLRVVDGVLYYLLLGTGPNARQVLYQQRM